MRVSPFLIFYISQSSVATQLRCGRENDNFIANFLMNPRVKEFLKLAIIWQSYEGNIYVFF